MVNKTGLNLDLITCNINLLSFLNFLNLVSSLYLSIKSIAELTHTHIKPNNHSCAGKLNGNHVTINNINAQINRKGITDKTRKGCLKFQKCSTSTENIKIIQMKNAFIRSVMEFCIS